MKSPKRMMECRNDTQKRSMLKKNKVSISTPVVYSCARFITKPFMTHSSFAFLFALLCCYNPASSDGSLVKSWSVSQPEDPFEKCLSKNFELLLLLLARKRGSPFAWWCLLMAAAPDPGLRSGHLLNVVGVSIWDLLLGLAPVIRLVTATLLLCISAPRSKSSCWYRGAAPPSYRLSNNVIFDIPMIHSSFCKRILVVRTKLQ